jgi:hypothetical protein
VVKGRLLERQFWSIQKSVPAPAKLPKLVHLPLSFPSLAVEKAAKKAGFPLLTETFIGFMRRFQQRRVYSLISCWLKAGGVMRELRRLGCSLVTYFLLYYFELEIPKSISCTPNLKPRTLKPYPQTPNTKILSPNSKH